MFRFFYDWEIANRGYPKNQGFEWNILGKNWAFCGVSTLGSTRQLK
jgi:hypothetical protein